MDVLRPDTKNTNSEPKENNKELTNILTKEQVGELFQKTADSYHALVTSNLGPFTFEGAGDITVDSVPRYTNEQLKKAAVGFKQWMDTDYSCLSAVLDYAQLQNKSQPNNENAQKALEFLSDSDTPNKPEWIQDIPESRLDERRKSSLRALKKEEIRQIYNLSDEEVNLLLGGNETQIPEWLDSGLDKNRKEKLLQARKLYFEMTKLKPRFENETAEILNIYREDLGHDLRAVFSELDSAFKNLEKSDMGDTKSSKGQLYSLNDFTFQYVEDLIRAVGRQVADKPIEEDFDPAVVLNKLEGLFMTLTAQHRNQDKNNKNRIDFQLNFKVDEGVKLHGDPGYFQQIFYNWINNSRLIHIQNLSPKELEDTEPEKIVSEDKKNNDEMGIDKNVKDYIPVINVGVKRLPDTGYIRPYVKDNAGGFPSKLLKNAYERGVSERQGGTGFGLSIVQRLAEGHFKGKVGVGNYDYKVSPRKSRKGANVWFTVREAGSKDIIEYLKKAA